MKKIILIATLLIFAGCSSDDTKETSTSTSKQEIKQSPVKEEVKAVETIKKEVVSEKQTKKVPVVKKEEIVVVVQEEVKEIKKEEPKKVVKATKSGAEVFKACVACHGKHAEKTALNKSKVIKGWDAAKVSAALNGYKNGTYGGSMKALMIGQVGFLTDDEVQSVSEYISRLK